MQSECEILKFLNNKIYKFCFWFKLNYLQTCYFTNAGIDVHSQSASKTRTNFIFVVIKLFNLVLIDNYCYHYDDENCMQYSFIDVKT